MLKRLLPLALIAIALTLSLAPGHSVSADPRTDPDLVAAVARAGRAPALILLDATPDLTPAYHLRDKQARGRWVYEALRAQAEKSQSAIVKELQRRGLPVQRFWLVNAIRTELDAATLTRIQQFPGVARIQSDAPIPLALPQPGDDIAPQNAAEMPWGVARVDAPWAWAQGYTGEGVVIAGQDTGYDWQHPALKAAYRGYDASTDTAIHSYNWHDAIHDDVPPANSGNRCGYNSPAPCDDQTHGTHTMGTMIGNDLAQSNPAWPAGAANPVGVAPGAKWIGCRNMDNGWGAPSTYIECFEWFVAPYPPTGDPIGDAFSNGNPDLAPDIINNSWSCPEAEGCTDDMLGVIEPAVNAADAAGIVVVVSAGNTGPFCGSVAAPPAIYSRAFAVGATTSSDALASFSSRGPVSYGGGALKPDVAAPGSGVRSSVPGGGYASYSGTSMAAPHTVGVMALLLDAAPELRGQTDLIKAIVARSADPFYDFTCGAEVGGRPNNSFGWGIVNARRAIESLDQSGLLAGKVTSSEGVTLPGAVVVARDPISGEIKASAVADAFGSYSLPLPWGSYQLEASRTGLAPAVIAPIYVVGGQTTLQNVQLAAFPLRQYIPLIAVDFG